MHRLTCCSSGIFSEHWLTKLLQCSKSVINGSPIFCLIEHKLESVTSIVMLKEKWEINLFASFDQDLIVPKFGIPFKHGLTQITREQSHKVGGFITRFSTRGTYFSDVINGLPFPQYFLNLGASKCFGNGRIYRLLSNVLRCKSLSIYRAYYFWTPNALSFLESSLNYCSNSSLGFCTIVFSSILLCLQVDHLL